MPLSEDTKAKVKLAAQLRLSESHISRLLKQVKTDVRQPMSKTSQRAANAARARWDRELDTP
jgi:hypothetical protein